MRIICSKALLICAIIPLGATYSWSCSLVNSPVVHIQISQPSQLNNSEVGGLFSEDDGGERRRRLTFDDTNQDAQYIESRECTCTHGMLPTEDKFYCPSPNDVSRELSLLFLCAP